MFVGIEVDKSDRNVNNDNYNKLKMASCQTKVPVLSCKMKHVSLSHFSFYLLRKYQYRKKVDDRLDFKL